MNPDIQKESCYDVISIELDKMILSQRNLPFVTPLDDITLLTQF